MVQEVASNQRLFSIPGEWLHILVHFLKAFHYVEDVPGPANITTSPGFMGINLANYRLQGLGYYWLASTSVSYSAYLGIGGFLHVSITPLPNIYSAFEQSRLQTQLYNVL